MTVHGLFTNWEIHSVVFKLDYFLGPTWIKHTTDAEVKTCANILQRYKNMLMLALPISHTDTGSFFGSLEYNPKQGWLPHSVNFRSKSGYSWTAGPIWDWDDGDENELMCLMECLLRDVTRKMIAANMYGPYLNTIEESLVSIHPSHDHPEITIQGYGRRICVTSEFFDRRCVISYIKKDFLDVVSAGWPDSRGKSVKNFRAGPIGSGLWGIWHPSCTLPLLGNCNQAKDFIELIQIIMPTRDVFLLKIHGLKIFEIK